MLTSYVLYNAAATENPVTLHKRYPKLSRVNNSQRLELSTFWESGLRLGYHNRERFKVFRDMKDHELGAVLIFRMNF